MTDAWRALDKPKGAGEVLTWRTTERFDEIFFRKSNTRIIKNKNDTKQEKKEQEVQWYDLYNSKK